LILSKCIDQIEEIAEMNIAFAATHRHSKVAESEVSDDNSLSSKRSRRSSNIQVDSMEILIGQTIVNDYGEVGRVVGIDPNGRPVLEVDDSDKSVVEVAEKISTNVDAMESLDVVNLENTSSEAETCSVAITNKCPIGLHAVNTSMTEDDSTIMCQTEIKQATSVDSEDIPMMVYYANHGNFQRGEDAGCLRCAELLRRGKSITKHMLGCPASSKNSITVNEDKSHNMLHQESSTADTESNTKTSAVNNVPVAPGTIDLGTVSSPAAPGTIELATGSSPVAPGTIDLGTVSSPAAPGTIELATELT
jgi:hypothetical protein